MSRTIIITTYRSEQPEKKRKAEKKKPTSTDNYSVVDDEYRRAHLGFTAGASRHRRSGNQWHQVSRGYINGQWVSW